MNLVSANFSDLLKPNIEIKKFPDGDSYIHVKEEVKEGAEVTFFHRLYPNQNEKLIEAMLILKMLKEKNCKITMVVPYLPYSRQDKIWKNGESLSAKYVCEMLSWAGVEKLITFDCHFLKKPGTFEKWRLKIENVSLNKKLIEYGTKLFKGKEFEVISPDLGANYMTGEKGKSMKKVRGEYIEGEEAYRKVEKIDADFEIKGKNFLIIDDMVAGGGTMIKAVENLKKNNAGKIICCTTHGFFLKNSLEKLEKMCNGVFCSNTIESNASKINFMYELEGKI